MVLVGVGADASSAEGLRVIVRPSAIYVVATSPAEVRAVCVAAGLEGPGVEKRMYADGRGTTATDGQTVTVAAGCRGPVRHVIVCAEGNQRCLAHEERHAREGAFHR
jgi:hypothetical protein